MVTAAAVLTGHDVDASDRHEVQLRPARRLAAASGAGDVDLVVLDGARCSSGGGSARRAG